MDDRGEKIVFLARELLESGMQVPTPVKKPIHISMSFKALCFTTFLAAAGSAVVTTALQENTRPLNRYEMTELKALIFYTSKTKNIDEVALRTEVIQKLNLSTFDDITNAEFSTARRYLQERAQ